MKAFLTLWLLLIITGITTFAQIKQPGKISGQLKDTLTNLPIADATVALLSSNDSSLIANSFSGPGGFFEFNNIAFGEYRLYITYMGYQSRMLTLQVTRDTSALLIGTIWLKKTGFTLKEVEIKEIKRVITLKKDTVEYNAAAFKLRENALMESLLKQLPGVTIDKDGTIRAQGKIISKILVEGKSFFGDDTKMASHNISAEMIDKVQLIDRKPDKHGLTGGLGEETEKVINVTIKKEHLNHVTGRVVAAYGTNGRFVTSAGLNRIGKKQQISFIGDGNNTNNIGIGEPGTGVYGFEPNGSVGVSNNWNAGINYNDEINEKIRVSANYYLSNRSFENMQSSVRQNILPDSIYYYEQNSSNKNKSTYHSLNLRLEYQIDSLTALTVSSRANYSNTNSILGNQYKTYNSKGLPINSGSLNNNIAGRIPSFFLDLQFDKKFKKPGRTFSAYLNYRSDDNSQKIFNKSDNLFMEPSGTEKKDSIDQLIDNRDFSYAYVLRLSYSEPITKHEFLEFNYTYFPNFSHSQKQSFNYNASKGGYDIYNDSLSNDLRYDFQIQEVNIKLNSIKEKFGYSLGLYAQLNALYNHDLRLQNVYRKNSLFLFPFALFNWNISEDKNLIFTYGAMSEQPTVAQLQPVPDNTNPLYIKIGNPDLKAALNNNFTLNYKSFNPRTTHTLFINMAATITGNKIINTSWIDSVGRQMNQYVNTNGTWYMYGEITNSVSIFKRQATLNTTTAFNRRRDISYNNGSKSRTIDLQFRQLFTTNFSFKERGDIGASGSVQYNITTYDLQKQLNTSYFTYTLSLNGNLNLPLGLVLGADIDYLLNTGRQAGYNLNITILNAYIGKTLLSHKQAVVRLQGFDLLKQNVSLRRSMDVNYIEDVRSQILQRFFLLSFTYYLKPLVKD
ncbi:Outer membrane receptor proteins, mostly Fe transport [Chitinophaga rupis]|uniref:Outer membrane receptor proteins, mostly Fe transport n=1 Tax=Chitinophaga rupis TaxID=573321 RepID=A0A1H7XX31_9BACT|nr:outer membrane beta-barrel protein [Chitinophaga rupis]SEM38502.1 Outer membrane receptor proteins, mostly Fe transport [Chitinophaga rupis]